MAEICVIGAGPAGSTAATRLSQLGHRVRIIERAHLPRPRLGECLTPGAMPLLAAIGLDKWAEKASCSRFEKIAVKWGGQTRSRDITQSGIIVDRGLFDLRLLEGAAASGVLVHQPAQAISVRWADARWRIILEARGQREEVLADFLVDARGRRGATRGEGVRTLALHQYSRAARRSTTPIIESGQNAWYWRVPLPNGLDNIILFVAPQAWAASPGGSPGAKFQNWIRKSDLVKQDILEPVGSVFAADSTSYISQDPVGDNFIRIGDSALAIDPISSSGVQKAIKSALSAAVVVNTLTCKRDRGEAAKEFYRAQLRNSLDHHRAWASQRYAEVAATNPHDFWKRRSSAGETPEFVSEATATVEMMASASVDLSPELRILPTPCIDDKFVCIQPALHHPTLSEPVVYLAGCRLAPLLTGLKPGQSPLQIAQSWEPFLPLATGLAIAGWLVNHGILVERRY